VRKGGNEGKLMSFAGYYVKNKGSFSMCSAEIKFENFIHRNAVM